MGRLADTIKQLQVKQPESMKFQLDSLPIKEPLVNFETPRISEISAPKVQTFAETKEALKTGNYQAGSLVRLAKSIQEGISTSGAYLGLGLKDIITGQKESSVLEI